MKLRDEPGQLQAQVLTVEQLQVQTEVRTKADAACKSLKAELTTWTQTMDSLRAGVSASSSSDMQEVVAGLDRGRNCLELRLQRVVGAVQKSQRASKLDLFVAGEGFRTGVALKLLSCIEQKGGSVDTLFDAIDSSRKGYINQADIRHFLESNGKQLQPAELETFLAARNGDDLDMNAAKDASLDKAALARAVRVYYKVAQVLEVSDGLEVENCKQMRRMRKVKYWSYWKGPKQMALCRVE
jgi:hypothetical protein